MSATLLRLRGLAGGAKPVSAAERDRLLKEGKDRFAELQKLGVTVNRICLWFGACGMAVGVLGLTSAVLAPPRRVIEDHYWQVDPASGAITQTATVQDAPKLFSDANTEFYLRRYIEAREAWVADMADENFHQVAIMSTPAEQEVFRKLRDKHETPDAPSAKYGRRGVVRVSNFTFAPQGSGRNGTKVWIVLFDRQEEISGALGPVEKWTATVTFSFRPELKMKPDDRSHNAAGLQVSTYHSDKA